MTIAQLYREACRLGLGDAELYFSRPAEDGGTWLHVVSNAAFYNEGIEGAHVRLLAAGHYHLPAHAPAFTDAEMRCD